MKDHREWIAELKKDIVFQTRLGGHDLVFHSTWGLFSPRSIDEGTALLFRHLAVKPDEHIFDLGCGYGPIGVGLAKMAPQGKVLMADKDYVAVEYANKNIVANRIVNAEAILSNGFSEVDERKFDLVVSNVPAKVGKELLSIFLYDALDHLNPGGRIVVVTINGLRQFMKRNFNEVFGNYKKLKQGRNYTVSQAIKF
ncbi:MAG: methyltransferase [Gammaproteobacteria bacterium]|nr:MAG: methyltransferase [Gammaproteobacteria bacterium]